MEFSPQSFFFFFVSVILSGLVRISQNEDIQFSPDPFSFQLMLINWKIKRDLPVSRSLIEILSHDQGGRRSHEIAQRMRQVIVLKPVVVSDIIQIPILHII